MSLDAMKQALGALEEIADEVFSPYDNKLGDAITALRAAIEQAHGDWDEVEALRASLREHMAEIHRLQSALEQEPVAWMNPSWIDPDTRGWASHSFESIQIEGWIPLYTAPRQWQGLTDDEIVAVYGDDLKYQDGDYRRYARAIEAKLKEKNT